MKTYLNGNIKEIEGKFGNFLKVSLKLEDLIKNKNDKGYINFVISKRKDIGKYGETHSAYIDDWKPTKTDEVQDIPF